MREPSVWRADPEFADRDKEEREAQQAKPNGRADGGLQIHDAGDIDPAKIPPRAWLLGVSFCRKFLSGLIGEGGVGKTAIRYAQYLAGATGRKDITGEHVHHRFRTLIVCLEDDLDEVQRRLAAAMLHHRVYPEEIRGWISYCTPIGLKLLREGVRGSLVIGELYEELRSAIAARSSDLVGIDPFVKAHGVSENDNNAIDTVCTMLAGLASEMDCDIDLTSHARKGNATPGDAERDRGASAKKDAGRLVRTATTMNADEAKLYGVKPEERCALIRLDDAKVNIARRSECAAWFKLISVPLGNSTEMYPRGDEVQTVQVWIPPDTFAGLTDTILNAILDRIENDGPYPGGRYSPSHNAKTRAAWPVIQEFCPHLTDQQCKEIINTWKENEVIVVKDYHDSKDRRDYPGLFVAKRPGNTWEC
jgi:hypothetical protein